MDRAATALLDSRDEAARRERADQELVANRFCPTTAVCLYGRKTAITWAPDGCSYVAEGSDPQVTRWAGYRALSEEGEDQDGEREPLWWGTRRTERGTYIAQFSVEAGE